MRALLTAVRFLRLEKIGMLTESPTFSLKRFQTCEPLSNEPPDMCPVPMPAERETEGKNPARACLMPNSADSTASSPRLISGMASSAVA